MERLLVASRVRIPLCAVRRSADRRRSARERSGSNATPTAPRIHDTGADCVILGRMHIRMDDGEELEIGPGGCDPDSSGPGMCPDSAGHDAWIVGDESYVGLDFTGDAEYTES